MVHSIHDLEQLQAQILNLTFEVVPAERGAILLDGNAETGISNPFSLVIASRRSAQPVSVSRTITQQVMEQGIAILGADVPRSNGLSDVESLVSSNVRSLLCVPLQFPTRLPAAFIWTRPSPGRFDEEHLQLVVAIAGISAVARGKARRVRWLEQENLRLTTEIISTTT